MDKALVLPLSILGAGTLVGAGVLLGLRSRAPQLPVGPTPSSIEAPAHDAPPATAPPATPAQPSPEAFANAAKDAAKALESARKDFVKTCWEPAIKTQRKPETSTYLFNMSFDAKGKETARGISELRDEDSRGDVADCLRAQQLRFTIPPPGTNVNVDVKLKLP